MPEVRFMTLDPGHFHASLVQKEMYPGVAPKVDVYAPLGSDLTEHLARITAFNTRAEKPTAWQLEIHTGPDFFERMLREKPGNVVVISGRNNGKIDRIGRSVEAGLNVLADKPWILKSADLPALDRALATADQKGVVAYDIMTERFEVTTALQRELVNDAAISGGIGPGTPDQPAVYMESVHHLLKLVAGAPNIRPAWFFDPSQQGEGLNDIGTHLVDLVQWTLYPNQAIDYRQDVKVLSAQRWPTPISEANFKRVTGGQPFPASVLPRVENGTLQYRLQHARLVRGPRNERHVERHLGLGAAGRRRRSPLRDLSRPQGRRRDSADEGGRLPAGALCDSEPGVRCAGAARCRERPAEGPRGDLRRRDR